MPLDIGAAVEEGARRTGQRNGLMLVAAFFLANLASSFAADGAGPLSSVGGSPVLTSVTGGVVTLLSIAISIVALRVFVSDETEAIPDEMLTRNMGWAIVHTIVGGLIFSIVVVAGLFLLIVPGIYLLLALFFWTVYVAVEDEGFYEAMQDSWEMTRGVKWSLLGLLVVVLLVNLLLSVSGVAVWGLNRGPLGMVVMQVLSAFGGVFALAVQARAYVQVTG